MSNQRIRRKHAARAVYPTLTDIALADVPARLDRIMQRMKTRQEGYRIIAPDGTQTVLLPIRVASPAHETLRARWDAPSRPDTRARR